jgi:hypothetical protein
VASYRDPTRCRRCHHFGHTSDKCSSRQPPISHCSHFSEGVLAPPYFATDVDGMVDGLLPLTCSPSLTSDERMMDPMLIEALLVAQRPNTERGTSSTLCVVSPHSPDREIHSPVMLRSEVE